MARSEIFEKYAEIAREQGLITKKAEKKGPRRGSDDISTIEALYGIKPNGKDEKDMHDQAHPESVVIAPAYDRVNGLVENGKERQNIMVGICRKPHQAKLTQHRYASTKTELVSELIRLGYLLESEKQEDLVGLADSCSEGLTKVALFPALFIGGAVIVGLLGVYNNFGDISQGVRADCQKVEAMLMEMISEDTYDAHDDALNFMLRNVQFVLDICDAIENMKTDLPDANLEGAQVLAQHPKSMAMEKLLQHFLKNARLLAREIPGYIKLLTAMDDNPNAPAEANWWAAAKSLYRKLDPSDAADLVAGFESLAESLSGAAQTADSIRKQYQMSAEMKQRKLIQDRQDEKPSDETPKAQQKKPMNEFIDLRDASEEKDSKEVEL